MKLPSNKYCDRLYADYNVPMPIITHCIAVAKLGVFLAGKLKEAGVEINVALVEALCRVHDAFKAASFKELAPLPEANYIPMQDEINFWKELNKKYPNMHETLICADVLKDGFPKFAKLVEQIGSTRNPCYLECGIEIKIAHYADWRVQFDKIISFDDRLAYLRDTYWSGENELWDERYEKEKELEREIFEKLDFEPDDLAV